MVNPRVWRAARFQLTAVLVVVLSAFAAFGHTWQFINSREAMRESSLAEADKRAQQLADAIGDQAEQLFRNVDFALHALGDAWLSGSAAFASTVRSMRSALPSEALANVSVIAPDGHIIYSAGTRQNGIYVGDREHFQVHTEGNTDRLYISRPLQGRVVPGWVIFVSRPIRRDGVLVGVVVVGLAPAFVSRWVDTVNLFAGNIVVLLRSDGSFLARNMDWQNAMGKAVKPDRPFLGAEATAGGVFRAPATLDAVPRIFGWQRLGISGLIAVVGLDQSMLTGPIDRQYADAMIRTLAFALAFLAFGASIAVILLRFARQQESLQASEARLQESQRIANLGNWELIHADDSLHWSEETYRIFEIDQKRFGATYQAFLDAVHPDDREKVNNAFARSLETRKAYEITHRLLMPDGRVKHIQEHCVTFYDPDGHALRSVGTVQDITERVRMQEELRAERDFAEGLIDTAQAIVLLLDTEGRIVRFNAYMEDLCGYTLEQVKGHSWFDTFLPESDRVDIRNLFHTLISKTRISGNVNAILTRDGQERLIEWHDKTLIGTDGKVSGILAIGQDVTERTRAEQALRESEERYRTILDNAADAIFVADLEGRYVYVNQKANQLLGYSGDELLGLGMRDLTSPEDAEKAAATLELLLRDGQVTTELLLKLRQGGKVPVEINTIQLPDGNVFGAYRDITERKRNEQSLQLAASVFSHAREGIAITDTRGNIVDVNNAFTDITGYTSEEVAGQKLLTLKGTGGESPDPCDIWPRLERNGYWSGELWSLRKDGMTYAETLTISAVNDEPGNRCHYVALFSDVTSQKKHQIQLEHIAHHDALTNLPNRVLLSDRLSQAMAQARRRNTLLAVVYLDLDGFKDINDTRGHDVGDAFLVTTARRIMDSVRQGDTCARLGGDEFIAVFVDLADTDACTPLLNRLLGAVVQPLILDNAMLRVTASIGVTFYPQNEPVDADQLLRQADQAMYQAKLAGKNQFHIFDASQDASARVRHESFARIRQALSNSEFRLHFQPKVNMRTGEAIGFEALIRWQHPERGLLLPGDFLHTLVNHPLGSELDLWVIENTLVQMEAWQAQGIPTAISVNLGAELIQREDFFVLLRQMLSAHPRVDPGWLQLEIVETSALEDMAQVTKVMAACGELGIGFALDDFGTGYSSLTYLKRLPATLIKIDQSFVRDIHDDPEDLVIVEGILSLASAFGRQIIAEGVETRLQAEMLIQLGCELAQGYAFAKPMPAEACAEWIRTWEPDPDLTRVQSLERERFPVLFAGVQHRAWRRSVEARLRGGTSPQPVVTDSAYCRYSQWLKHGGLERHAHHPAFQSLQLLHEQAHALADELIKLQSEGRTDQAISRLPEFETVCDRLYSVLKSLL